MQQCELFLAEDLSNNNKYNYPQKIVYIQTMNNVFFNIRHMFKVNELFPFTFIIVKQVKYTL